LLNDPVASVIPLADEVSNVHHIQTACHTQKIQAYTKLGLSNVKKGEHFVTPPCKDGF